MKMRKAWAGALLLAGSLPALSQTTGVEERLIEMQVARAARNLESAFVRKYAALDAQGQQPAMTSGSDWFPGYGFAPSMMGLGWSFQPLDTDLGALCITVSTSTAARHATFARAFALAGLSPSGSGCQALSGWPAPGSSSTLSARKVLDRRDAPVATLLPSAGGVTLTGADGSAVTRPGLTLLASSGQTGAPSVLTVSNPLRWVHANGAQCTAEQAAEPETDCTPLASSLIEVNARPGFTVTHTCASIAAGSGCSVTLTYTNAGERYLTMPLRLVFSTGEIATIGVLGRRAP